MSRLFSLLALVAVLAGCGDGERGPGSYPARSIQLVVPYSAGGGTDLFARLIAGPLEDRLGRPVVVINRPGAAGEIGLAEIARARPDGHLLGVVSFPDTILRTTYKDTAYRSDQFTYLASFTDSATVLIARKGSPVNSLDDLIRQGREHPGRDTVAVSGDGHVYTLVQLEKAADIRLTPIAFAGGGSSFNAILGGHVEAALLAQQFAEQAESQGLKLLAISADQRDERIPHVPTFRELGYDVEVVLARIVVAPQGTPVEIVDRLREILGEIGAGEGLKRRVTEMGEVYRYREGDDLLRFLERATEVVHEVVKGREDAFRRNF